MYMILVVFDSNHPIHYTVLDNNLLACEPLTQFATLQHLVKVLHGDNSSLIAVDGWCGAGKSFVASTLQRELGISIIKIDDYLLHDRRPFLKRLRYRDIGNSLTSRPILIEGIFALEVLEALGISPDVLIYVKVTSYSGDWIHERMLEQIDNRAYIDERIVSLNRQLACYHKKLKPHLRANYILNNSVEERWGEDMANSSNEVQIEIAVIREKTKLAIVLAIGGMVTLIVGLVVFLNGVSGSDETLIKFPHSEFSAKGLGGVIMATSSVWAYFAYLARPKYHKSKSVQDKRDSDASLVERIETESSTLMR